ncbi:MAG: Na+/H+ antiporter NhaC family protein [Chitinophagales bacterium]
MKTFFKNSFSINKIKFKDTLKLVFELFIIGLLWGFCSLQLAAQDTTNQTELTDAELDSVMTISGDSLGLVADVVIPVRHQIDFFDANVVANGDKYSLEVLALDAKYRQLNEFVTGRYDFNIDGEDKTLNFTAGKANVTFDEIPQSVYLEHQPDDSEKGMVHFFQFKEKNGEMSKWEIPTWVSILPPLIAILLALIFKEVVTSLFIGIWIGAWMLYGFDVQAFFWSFLHTVDKYIIHTLTDADHVAIMVFSFLIGGMVAIISRNGGMAGVVNGLSKLSNSARSSQLVTWLMGLVIFFDDYANTLVVGNTMRSLTDKFRVSREKLAYIVDSTAAPVAAIALITTWIGAELSYIGDVTGSLGINESPYSIFINSLQYSFYPVFTLVFILFIAILNRDFGPMYTAEMRARTTGKVYYMGLKEEEDIDVEDLNPIKSAPHRAINAILPVLVIIIGTFVGLWYTGMMATDWATEIAKLQLNAAGPEDLTLFAKLPIIIGNSNSYSALLWSSTFAVTTAILLTLSQGIMSLRATMETMMVGIKTMMGAMIVLILAWSLAQVTKDLHTADFLSNLLAGNLNPLFLPVIIFLLAALIAFSTGSSWSTMAILYPIALPLAWAVCQAEGLPIDLTMQVFYAVTSSVLAGSVLGDHCSPISDTTILSSLASQCNHIEHVRTQMPYALTVGMVSTLIGGLSMYYQLPAAVSFGSGLGILLLIVLLFGKRVPEWASLQQASENQEQANIEAEI